MLSILKPTAKIASPNQSQPDGQNFLSELMKMVDDSSPDDTGEMLRLKMAKSVEWCDKKLSESMSLASQYEFQETMMIVIQLYDDKDRPIPTCQWLRNGFRFESVSSPLLMKQELLLINHAIAAYLQLMQNVPLGSQRSAAALPYIPQALARPFPAPSNNKFVLSPSSLFILRFSQADIQLGEVHIRPAATFPHPEFVQKLGKLCFRNSVLFSTTVKKVSQLQNYTYQRQ